MEINIYQQVYLKDKLNSVKQAYREFESDVIPHKGDFYTDSAFKDPYEHEITQVTIDYKNDVCSVYIDSIVLDSTDVSHVKKYVEMMMLHGWKCNVIDL